MTEIEHNEARMVDVEIPLFQLEQRVEKLEHGFQQHQVELVGKMLETLTAKIN